MVETENAIHLFESYFDLSKRIKEISLKGDLDGLEELLGKREDCQKRMGLILERDMSPSDEKQLPHLLEVLYRARDVNEEILLLLQERKEEIMEAIETINKGHYLQSSYRSIKNSTPGGSLFDERS